MAIGKIANELTPVIKGLFDKATTKIGEGLFKASNTEMGIPYMCL